VQRDHEEGRDQRELMEGVDEENIRGEEGPKRTAADQQRGDVENGRAVLICQTAASITSVVSRARMSETPSAPTAKLIAGLSRTTRANR
jgi:hypothetical protein